MKITEQTKHLIIEKVIATSYLTQFYYKQDFILFLKKLLPLRQLPSTDPRYKNAEDDCHQHLVNNEDWDIHYLFTQRFDFINDDVKFKELLNLIVHPDYSVSVDEIQKIVIQINRYLEKENYHYIIVDYDDENNPIHRVSIISKDEIVQVHRENKLPIYVIYSPVHIYNFNNVHPKPSKYPSFNLVLNNAWNDYGLVSTYCLFYFDENGDEKNIGDIKIISELINNLETNTTLENILPTHFSSLDISFCSLGQDINYYQKLKTYIGSNFEDFLWALKDCAFFPILQERFETHQYFGSSLIRHDKQEKLLREVKVQLYGLNPSDLYKFSYKFKPPFSDDEKEINFDFSDNYYFNRIYCVIGKNGVGKTQFISSLPKDISKNNKEKFYPSKPEFSKVIAISYSAYDSFEIPESNSQFNYVFCGLKSKSGKLLSEITLNKRFLFSLEKIKTKNRLRVWFDSVKNFIDESYINNFFDDNFDTINTQNVKNTRKILSSGQTILLDIITEVIANIRLNSIILYDEPETHLHPNAISQIINTIFSLLVRFDSFCIITTHSPLIIREVISKNVYVFEREESYFNIKQLSIETFGENLTTITDEIFGNRALPNHYKEVLVELVSKGYSLKEIKEIISDSIPLSFSASLFLQNLLDEKK